MCDNLVIYGSPNRVVDQILAFREKVGDFGTLLYAGKDLERPALGRRSMTADGGKGDAAGERRDQQGVDATAVSLP